MPSISRRALLVRTGAVAASAALAHPILAAEPPPATRPSAEPFRYCLNTGTIRGQRLTIVQEVEIAAKAGYQAIEPWISELETYAKSGGSLPDLRKRIEDAGLSMESAIGFSAWIVDDDEKRRQGLEQFKRDMELVHQAGGKRVAAPPVGATSQTDLNLFAAAERYRALVELGRNIGVIPQVELWGGSKAIRRLSEALFVAIESGQPEACVLADVFHMYKGGSEFSGLRFVHGAAMQVFHINDYPAQPPRAEITDAQRVYPGDGVAPLTQILRDLRDVGYRGVLSLELFNRDYWQQDALTVAKTGLEKIRAAVAKAFG